MTIQALARTYRPQTFSELVGQDIIAQTLANAITSKRLHHAYIFTGTRGVGKTTTARIFAKALNCQNGPTPTPCLQCAQCLDIAQGRSVDVLEIDAASHTKVEETRELLGHVAYAPAAGHYRVFIIDEAHMLSKSSFNALLKTLEEPPAHAIFILATTEPQKILDTVRSRCIELVFRRIGSTVIAQELARILAREVISFEHPAIERIATEADGSMRDALSLTDQVIGFAGQKITMAVVESALGLTRQDLVVALWESIFARHPQNLHHVFLAVYQQGADLQRFAHDSLALLQKVILQRNQENLEQTNDDLKKLVDASKHRSLSDLHRLFDMFHQTLVELERSPLPEIYFETALLKLVILEPLAPLESLLERLEQMAQQPGQPLKQNFVQQPKQELAASKVDITVQNNAPVTPNEEKKTADTPPASTNVATNPMAIIDQIAQQIPSLATILAGAYWQENILVVPIRANHMLAQRLLEDRKQDILTVAARLGIVNASMDIIVTQVPVSQNEEKKQTIGQFDKRQFLEDKRIAGLLKALPGSEIIDVKLRHR